MASSIDELRQELETFITAAAGGPARVTGLRPIAGGASRETWAIEVTIESGPETGAHALVVRRDMATTMNPNALDRVQEFRLLEAAHRAGVIVPRPRWLAEEAAPLYFLMDRVEGDSIGRRVVRERELAAARRVLPEQMARQLALIHQIDPDRENLSFLPRPVAGRPPALDVAVKMRAALVALDVYDPLFETALGWLEANVPPCERLTLLHGDFRVGNLIVGPEGLRAVIDWEFAHIGDPLEDVAWPCVRDWRFGRDDRRVGGVGDLEPYLAAYERASERSVDRAAVRYWEIMGNLKWAVTCLVQAHRHLSGEDPSVELASLGRRSAEMQWELLDLIEREGSTDGPDDE
jgi:aminoglycoside phosphotransferase (APT) family kinase protein